MVVPRWEVAYAFALIVFAFFAEQVNSRVQEPRVFVRYNRKIGYLLFAKNL